MKDEFVNIALNNNEALERFELEVDGHIAFITYEKTRGVLRLLHTESPQELAGRGVASALVEKTLLYIKEHNLKLQPLCPFVNAYIKRNTEWENYVVRA